jgi:hypothetical protein
VWSASHPEHFTPRERAPGTHWTGGWVGPRDVLDAVVKRKIPSPHQETQFYKTPKLNTNITPEACQDITDFIKRMYMYNCYSNVRDIRKFSM